MMKITNALKSLSLLILLYLPVAAVAMELPAIAQLSRQGAPQLALKLIQQYQPAFEEDSAAWYEWESRRLQIEESRKAWQAIIKRIGEHPEGLSEEFLLWREQLLIKAYLQRGQGEQAREHLAKMIWAESQPSTTDMQRYRDLIIRSYMLDGASQAAHIAMLRYQQDYPQQEQDTLLLRAEVLLANEHYADVKRLLAPLKAQYPRLLHMLAQVRLGEKLNSQQQKSLRWLSSRDDVPKQEQILAWGIRAEYDHAQGQLRGAILAQEQLMALGAEKNPFFQTRAERLWQWYDELALEIANARQLLQGQDEGWLKLAKARLNKEPTESRALYAHVATTTNDSKLRDSAHKALMESLLRLKQGERLAESLYRPLYRQQGDTWPMRVKYFLAERALVAGDVTEASRYLLSLDHAPEGEDNTNWNLRRARVLIMAGMVDQAYAVLEHLITTHKLSKKETDKLMQVLFDLQTVQAHEQAVRLFQALLGKSKSLKLQRELYFWIAESHAALGEYEKASLSYLKSAAVSGGGEGVLWAQSARYQAARALVNAGLLEDARGIFVELLAATQDEGRKARLRHEMQLLRLKQIEAERKGA